MSCDSTMVLGRNVPKKNYNCAKFAIRRTNPYESCIFCKESYSFTTIRNFAKFHQDI